MIVRRLAAFTALLLTGCVDMGNVRAYPSLARRPAETGIRVPQTVAPADGTPQTIPAAVDQAVLNWQARVPLLVTEAGKGRSAFDGSYSAISAQVRTAGQAAPVSESWSVAHVAISRLDSLRYGSVSALADMDLLYANRARAIAGGLLPAPEPVDDSLAMARRETLDMVDSQNDRLDQLKALLRQP